MAQHYNRTYAEAASRSRKGSSSAQSQRSRKPSGTKRGTSGEPKNNKNKKSGFPGIFIAAGIAVIVMGIFMFSAYAKTNSYDLIYPNVYIHGVDLSGMTEQEAAAALKTSGDNYFSGKTLDIIYKDNNISLTADEIELSSDPEKGAEIAINYGKDFGFWKKRNLVKGKNGKIELEAPVIFNTEAMSEKVDEFIDIVSGDTAVSCYTLEDSYIEIDFSDKGLMIDKATIISDLTDKLEKGDFTDYTATPVEITPETMNLQELYDQIFAEAADAYIEYVPVGYTDENAESFDLENYNGKYEYRIVNEVEGVSFDLEAAKQLFSGEEKTIYRIDLIKEEPAVKYGDIEAQIYRDVLGSCTTKLNTREVARTTNVRLATEAVTGTELMPGEIFSYNETVGPRTEKRGYQEAKIFANGEVVDGIGGGICQLSSTLYISTLLADLETVSRTAHRFAVSYTPIGQDATVAWPSLDYKFKNDTEWPVKIKANLDGGSLTVTIYGTKLDKYTYSLYSVTNETIDFEEVTKYISFDSDKAIEFELTELGQSEVVSGKKGYKSTTYKITSLDGEEVAREVVNNSYYKTQNKTTYIAAYLDKNGNPLMDNEGNLIDPNAPVTSETTTTTTTETTTDTTTDTSTGTDTETTDTIPDTSEPIVEVP